MAEGIFNKLAAEKGVDVIAESFGVDTVTGMSVSQNSVDVCAEIGVDIKEKKSTYVSDVQLDKYEKFYCMSESHAGVLEYYFAVPFDKVEVIGVSDPYGGSIEIYRACRDEIYNSVKEILKAYENS